MKGRSEPPAHLRPHQDVSTPRGGAYDGNGNTPAENAHNPKCTSQVPLKIVVRAGGSPHTLVPPSSPPKHDSEAVPHVSNEGQSASSSKKHRPNNEENVSSGLVLRMSLPCRPSSVPDEGPPTMPVQPPLSSPPTSSSVPVPAPCPPVKPHTPISLELTEEEKKRRKKEKKEEKRKRRREKEQREREAQGVMGADGVEEEEERKKRRKEEKRRRKEEKRKERKEEKERGKEVDGDGSSRLVIRLTVPPRPEEEVMKSKNEEKVVDSNDHADETNTSPRFKIKFTFSDKGEVMAAHQQASMATPSSGFSTPRSQSYRKGPEDSSLPPRRSEYPPETKMRLMLDRFCRKDEYAIFIEPVDSRHVPDYYTIIKNPMDFQTMRRKLRLGMYRDYPGAFVEDFECIITNAKTYNAPDSFVHQEALKMHAFGRSVIEKSGLLELEQQSRGENRQPHHRESEPQPLPSRGESRVGDNVDVVNGVFSGQQTPVEGAGDRPYESKRPLVERTNPAVQTNRGGETTNPPIAPRSPTTTSRAMFLGPFAGAKSGLKAPLQRVQRPRKAACDNYISPLEALVHVFGGGTRTKLTEAINRLSGDGYDPLRGQVVPLHPPTPTVNSKCIPPLPSPEFTEQVAAEMERLTEEEEDSGPCVAELEALEALATDKGLSLRILGKITPRFPGEEGIHAEDETKHVRAHVLDDPVPEQEERNDAHTV